MDARKSKKVERYLKNSRRFLWGLGPGNQKDIYAWLRGKGYEIDGKPPYSRVTDQLLENKNVGIEKIITELIIPRVKELFSDSALDFLRKCWEAGTIPDFSFVKLYNIENPYPFLEVNPQFHYVERWGELAGVWFEEIDERENALAVEPTNTDTNRQITYTKLPFSLTDRQGREVVPTWLEVEAEHSTCPTCNHNMVVILGRNNLLYAYCGSCGKYFLAA